MRGQLFAAALAVGSAAGAVIYDGFEASLEARQTETNCPTLHTIATGGANSTDPSSYGKLGSLANLITSMVPGSDMVSSPYNKVQLTEHTLQPGAIQAGIVNLETYVSQFVQSCPKSKVALIGYSSGAVITMGSFCGGSVSQSLAGKNIIAVTVYGDQTRNPGQPYDVGTGPSCVGKDASLRNPATCGSFIPIIRSWCDLNDPECCDGPPADYMIHLQYPKYDSVAAQWVVDHYNAAVGGASTGSSSSSASATSSASTTSNTASAASAASASQSSAASALAGLAGAASSASAASAASASSASSTASAASSSATSAASASASSASSAAVASKTSTAASGASSAASSAAAGASSGASSATAAAGAAVASASSTLTPANPNGASLVAPSLALGAVGLIMAALF